MGNRVGNIINNVRNKCIGANPEGESGPGGPPSSRSERFRVSEIKKGTRLVCSTNKGPQLRPFICGAYENIWQEAIGIKNGVKLLILIEIHKNVFRAFPSD